MFLIMPTLFIKDFYSMNFSRKPEPVKQNVSIYQKTIDSVIVHIQALVYSKPDSMRMLAEKVYKTAKKIGHLEWQAKLLGIIGISYTMESDYLTARKYFYDALDLAVRSGNFKSKGEAYNNLGGIDFITSNYRNALENFLEAIQNYEAGGYYTVAAEIHTNIGILYVELNNIEKAFYHLKKGYQQLLQLENIAGQTIALNSLAHAYLDIDQKDSAMYYVNKSIGLSEEANNQYSLANALKLKAGIYLKSNLYSDASEFYFKSLKAAQQINNGSMISNSYLGLSRLFFELNEIEESLSYAHKALELATNIHDLKMIKNVHTFLSSIYEHIGDFETSLQHRKMADDLNMQISDQSKLHQIYNIEISQLIKDKEIQKLEIDRQRLLVSKRNSLIIIISLLFTILMAILFLIFTKTRQQQKIKLKETLFRHAEERSKSALNAEVNERKRLGIELHDGVGPLLSLAKLNVTALIENDGLHEKRKTAILHNTVDTLDEVLKEMKNISHNMAPIVLIEKGFEVAVRDLVSKLNETEKYRVTLDINGLNGSIGHYHEHVLYRSILEIIHNSLLHANGSEIHIQIIQNEEDITIMIEDNGKGFKMKEKLNGNGLGLKSTISRIEGLKGEFYIDSEDGRGTIVTMIVPLDYK